MNIQSPVLRLRAALFTFALTASSIVSPAQEDFNGLVKRLTAEKPQFAQRQQNLLKERYDLSSKPVEGLTMAGQ